MMKEDSMSAGAFILAAQRTPIGSFQGGLGTVPAPRLGAAAIQAALKKSGLQPADIQECIMGEVLSAGVGQAPARQAAIFAGLPTSVPALTVNKVCGSGLKSIMLGADSISLGYADAIVAGGQENMTLAPHLLENSRIGFRMGPAQMTDSMIKDGLWDPFNNWHMGSAGELCVREFRVTREEQDEFAKSSYLKAQKAQSDGAFQAEITPVEIAGKGASTVVDTDEEPLKARFDKMSQLKPAFDKDGTITAANASKLNDGGAAVVLASEALVQKKGLRPMARIVAHSTFAQDPKWFTTAPIGAMKLVCERAGLSLDKIDLFEINEAFSVVTMAAIKELKLPPAKVNIHGGAVALGHPIGASGARLLVTLVHALEQKKARYGMASLCIGGGEAVAVIVERL
jgi:acetyl-CoA C-acetyltransferase